MQFAHFIFLSLYTLQATGSYINVDAQHEIAKRGRSKGMFSFFGSSSKSSSKSSPKSSSGSSSKSSSKSSSDASSGSSSGSSKKNDSNSSSSKKSDSNSSAPKPNDTKNSPSITVAAASPASVTKAVKPDQKTSEQKDQKPNKTSETASQITSAVKETSSEPEIKSKNSSLDANTMEANKKQSFMKKFGETVKDFAIEAVGGIVVQAAVHQIVNAGSGSDSTISSSADMQAVEFVTTDSNGSVQTTIITAAASAFSTGNDGKVYIKTDATNDIVAGESSIYDASAATATAISSLI